MAKRSNASSKKAQAEKEKEERPTSSLDEYEREVLEVLDHVMEGPK